MLLNKTRAYEIMDKYGLDGLLAVNPRNIYYLTDFSGFNNRTQRTFYEYAVFPRVESAPAAYVTTAVELPRLVDVPTWVPNIVSYTRPLSQNTRDYDPATEDVAAGIHFDWPTREGKQLSAKEQQWLSLKENYGEQICSSPASALRQALRDAGLEKGRLGTDDPRAVSWMNEMGLPNVSAFEGTNVFREIRMIKSQTEISLLSEAARINEDSMKKAINLICEGMSWHEVERNYFTEMASQDAQGVYIAAGPGGLPHGKVVPGEPMMFDALGQYHLYHGDIGRTAVFGEPSREVVRRSKAMMTGWAKAAEIMKPGLSGQELTSQVIDVIAREGFAGFMIVTPHSIGLEHTDHPLPIGPEVPGSKGDFIFLENMVVNIDMPYIEHGWGAMHLEDTVLITSDGFHPLTSQATELVVIDT